RGDLPVPVYVSRTLYPLRVQAALARDTAYAIDGQQVKVRVGCHALLARDTRNPRLLPRLEQPPRKQRTQSEEWKEISLFFSATSAFAAVTCVWASKLAGGIFPHPKTAWPAPYFPEDQ